MPCLENEIATLNCNNPTQFRAIVARDDKKDAKMQLNYQKKKPCL